MKRRLTDLILDLRAASVELNGIGPSEQLPASFYLKQLDEHLNRIADRGQHIGGEVLEEISIAVELAYKAGLQKG